VDLPGPIPVPRGSTPAETQREITETVQGINRAFMRSDLEELLSYMAEDVTMLHGHERINNAADAKAEWVKLFEIRKRVGIAYTLKTADMRIQNYGDNSAIVTFSYQHPRVSGSRIATERGKAVYVLNRPTGQTGPFGFGSGQRKPWLMTHCAVVADREGVQTPLP